MTIPLFVDSSPWNYGGTPWPASLVFNVAGDLPGGLTFGDRLIVAVQSSVFPSSPAPSFAVSDDNGAWAQIPPSVGQSVGGNLFTLNVFTSRYMGLAALPIVVLPDAAYAGTYKALMFAFSPSASPSGTHTTFGGPPGNAITSAFSITSSAPEGTFVAILATADGDDITAVNTHNGWTEALIASTSPSPLGDLRVAVQTFAVPTTTAGIRWDMNTPHRRAGLAFRLDDPDPVIHLRSPLLINRVGKRPN